jgi:hypothetical protein
MTWLARAFFMVSWRACSHRRLHPRCRCFGGYQQWSFGLTSRDAHDRAGAPTHDQISGMICGRSYRDDFSALRLRWCFTRNMQRLAIMTDFK